MSKDWSNIAKIVYKRTYARNDNGTYENWNDTIDRVLKGNKIPTEEEFNEVKELMLNRKAMPAGRGLWFSGAPSHKKLGGAALNNCWFTTADNIENFVMAQDLLMLGGGVGLSVEHKFVSKLTNFFFDFPLEELPIFFLVSSDKTLHFLASLIFLLLSSDFGFLILFLVSSDLSFPL